MRILGRTLICFSLMTLPAWAITCGDILGPGGVYTLTADLSCPDADRPALTLTSGAVLDLGGFTLRTDGIGVTVEGHGATIRHGNISARSLPGVGIELRGEGRHTVEDLTTQGEESGIDGYSDGNRIRRNTISGGAGIYAMQLVGHHNLIRQNTFIGGEVSIGGDENTIIGNRILQSYPSFTVYGDGSRLARNTIGEESDSHYAAIQVIGGQRNLLWQNTALGEQAELFDDWGDCAHNLWIGNEADVSHPPCILEGPLAVSQVR